MKYSNGCIDEEPDNPPTKFVRNSEDGLEGTTKILGFVNEGENWAKLRCEEREDQVQQSKVGSKLVDQILMLTENTDMHERYLCVLMITLASMR